MLSIRLASLGEADEICMLDQNAGQSGERGDFIRKAVAANHCYVAVEEHILGYAILEYTFYAFGFVSLLYVRQDRRRSGVGSELMKYLEGHCRTDRLFTSTNLSNLPMQSLLGRLGYNLSGVIHDLDEDDPELVYVKYLFRRVGISA
jgi:GNAT superfamily N-acetyltransferase